MLMALQSIWDFPPGFRTELLRMECRISCAFPDAGDGTQSDDFFPFTSAPKCRGPKNSLRADAFHLNARNNVLEFCFSLTREDIKVAFEGVKHNVRNESSCVLKSQISQLLTQSWMLGLKSVPFPTKKYCQCVGSWYKAECMVWNQRHLHKVWKSVWVGSWYTSESIFQKDQPHYQHKSVKNTMKCLQMHM